MVALFLFQLGSGVYLATHSDVRPMDRFRTFQIASGIFLAAYVLGHGHMNSVFVFARLYLGARWIFQAFLTDPDGALWRRPSRCRCRIMAWACPSCCRISRPERVLMLSHGVARLYADRFLIGGATAAGLVAFAIIFGAAPGLTSPYPDPR